MDPLSAGMLGWKAGNLGVDLWYGTHGNVIEQAVQFFTDYENSNYNDERSLDRGIALLENIPTDEKDYLLSLRNYFLALGYFWKDLVPAAIRCLDFIDSIEIGALTAKPKCILDCKQWSKELRCSIEDYVANESNHYCDDDSNEYEENDDDDDDEILNFQDYKECLNFFVSDRYHDIDEFLTAVQNLIYKTCSPTALGNLSLIAAVACLDEFKTYPYRCCYTTNIKKYLLPGCNFIKDAQKYNHKSLEIDLIHSTIFALYDFCKTKNFSSKYYEQQYKKTCDKHLENLECEIFAEKYIKALYNSIFDFILSYCTPDGVEEVIEKEPESISDAVNCIWGNTETSSNLNDSEQEYLTEYKDMLADGEISDRDRRYLNKIMKSNSISEQRAKELEQMASAPNLSEGEQEYLDEYREIISEGEISARDQRFLDKLKKMNGISESRAKEIEAMI